MFDSAILSNVKVEYAFDGTNPNWSPDHTYNLVFLRAQQRWHNDKLHAERRLGEVKLPLFLNDVLRDLGFLRTRAGQIVGWSPESTVDYGVTECGGVYILTFNIDGPVVDLIPE